MKGYDQIKNTTVHAELLPEHIEVLRIWAESHSKSEVLMRSADMIARLQLSMGLQGPLPSDVIRYCERLLDERIYALTSAD